MMSSKTRMITCSNFQKRHELVADGLLADVANLVVAFCPGGEVMEWQEARPDSPHLEFQTWVSREPQVLLSRGLPALAARSLGHTPQLAQKCHLEKTALSVIFALVQSWRNQPLFEA